MLIIMRGFFIPRNKAGYGVTTSGFKYDGITQSPSKFRYIKKFPNVILTLHMSNNDDTKYGTLTVRIKDKQYMVNDKVDMNREYLFAISVSVGGNKFRI